MGEELKGEHEYSSVSAVVGATYSEKIKNIRSLAKHTYFLIPGYAAQEGKAEDIALAFDLNGLRGIIKAIDIPVMGLGGIVNSDDAIEFLLAGANAISIGTGNFIKTDTSIEIIEGIEKYMKEFNIEKIEDLVGKVEMN